MNDVDIILSICYYQRIDVLLSQIDNFKNFIKCSYIIILHCGVNLYNELKNIELPKNIVINPKYYNKDNPYPIKNAPLGYCSPKIAQGHYDNIDYSLNNYNFKYLFLFTQKTFLYNYLYLKTLDNLQIESQSSPPNNWIGFGWPALGNYNEWHWFRIYNSIFYNYYRNYKNQHLYTSPNEGVGFNYNSCKSIHNFFKNEVMFNDVFNNMCAPVEEFAFQTISTNESEGWIYIGNGCLNPLKLDPNKFIIKLEVDHKDIQTNINMRDSSPGYISTDGDMLDSFYLNNLYTNKYNIKTI
jgi:hypothetical protein